MDFDALKKEIEKHPARLIAVSKTQSLQSILAIYAKGQRMFAENRVQELLAKKEALPTDIEWHMIGTLQTNKVKYLVPFIAMIHTLDSVKLLLEVQKQALKIGRIVPCLIQFHIATEETKHGFDMAEVQAFFEEHPPEEFTHIAWFGVMGMATYTDNQAQVEQEFAVLRSYFMTLKHGLFARCASFREISMGMSGDWDIALKQGSTLVRIGSLIFGKR
jgi:PLP dependent protein